MLDIVLQCAIRFNVVLHYGIVQMFDLHVTNANEQFFISNNCPKKLSREVM